MGWYGTLASLAKEDVTKISEILAHPIGDVFNMLVYQVKKAQMEEDLEKIRQQEG